MKESSHATKLSWQIRSLCLLDDGMAVGGIEGRVELFHNTLKQKCFYFRCHRTSSDMHSVNAISGYTKNNDYIITGGSDNNLAAYDRNLRQKVFVEDMKGQVTCFAINKEGSHVVVGTGYDWSRGYEENQQKSQVRIMKLDSSVLKERT